MTMDFNRARDLLMEAVEMKLGKMPIHKRLSVLRYMKTYIRFMADFEVDEAIRLDEGKGKLSPELEYKLEQASKGYDNWMAKHNRVVRTREEKAEAGRRLTEWADAGFQMPKKS